jgi:polysaccharide export outer membrane protein
MFARGAILLVSSGLILGGCAAHDLGEPVDLVAAPLAIVETAFSTETHPEAAVAGWSATAVPVATEPGLAPPADHYLLDTGDRLRVFVYGQPNLSRLYTVDHDGKITVPLIGAVRARGLTTYGLEAVVRQRLGAQYVKDPQVTIDIHQNRPFFILGEVRTAGQYPYVSGMTIETAVAIAGGYSERASMRRARVTRRTNGVAEVFEDVPMHFIVRPGDTVFIRERFL